MAMTRRLRWQAIPFVFLLTLALAVPASLGQSRDIAPSPVSPARGAQADAWAVIIGINDYQHPRVPKLSYAVNDARALERTLVAQGFSASRIVTLVDREATKARIETLLGDELRQKVGTNDRVLVFFAGHGKTDRLRSGEDEGYLMPVDGDPGRLFGTAISMTALRQISDRLPARHILYIVDACYSGYAIFNRSISEDLLEEMIRKPAIQILTAGRQQDQAQERGGHGVFTEVLLRGLSGDAFGGKGWLALEELGVWVKQRVYAESNKKQLPQYGNLSGEGQFVFLRAGAQIAARVIPPVAPPAPTPVATTPAPALGSIALLSKTSGVELWLGERRVGEATAGSELIVSDVAIGTHKVVARKAGRTWERSVEVTGSDRARIAVEIDAPTLPSLPLLSEVLPTTDAQYVEAPDYARFRLGALRGLEKAIANAAIKLEADAAAPTLTYRRGSEPPARLVFAPGATRDEAVRDIMFAYELARTVAPPKDPARLEQEIVAAALSGLDIHSTYMDAAAFKEIQVETSGTFGGLGIEITSKEGRLTVVTPIEGTPASRAGLQTDDAIVAIDDTPTEGMALALAIKRLRGTPGTKVTLTVKREAWPTPRRIEIVREQIRVTSVQSRELEPGIGYVKIRQFQERTPQDVEAALKALTPGFFSGSLRGLVLDLRNNPGGLLSSAVEVTEKFIDNGKLIVATRGRQPNQNMRFTAKAKPYTGFPMVVLVNKGSASASEIVTGALQDWKRAVVMGTTTFGKGSVQTIIPLGSGGALRLTTTRYFTPRDRSIDGSGITPDVVLEAAEPPAPGTTAPDVQLDRALAHLKGMIGGAR